MTSGDDPAELPGGAISLKPFEAARLSLARLDLPQTEEMTRALTSVAQIGADAMGVARVGVWLCGGGLLAAALADEIDRLVLKVNPVVLGEGPTLFDGAYAARYFDRTAVTAFDSGVVVTEYGRRRRPAGSA